MALRGRGAAARIVAGRRLIPKERRGLMTSRLNEVIPWGRSLEEYRRMFALGGAALAGRILGCGDGPASFNAEATALGHSVISCDPIYAFSMEEIRQRVEDSHEKMISRSCWSRWQRSRGGAGRAGVVSGRSTGLVLGRYSEWL